MKRVRSAARGFTLPLTTVLVFSIMSLGAAVAAAVAVSGEAAKSARARLVSTVTLESAVEESLSSIERDGGPAAAPVRRTAQINQLAVSVIMDRPAGKVDVNTPEPDEIKARLAKGRVPVALADKLAQPLSSKAEAQSRFTRFRDFVAAARLNPTEEDCARRVMTIGQLAQGAQETEVIVGGTDRAPVLPGDVVDVRAETTLPDGGVEVLWVRARFSGARDLPWRTHDWRRLGLGRRAAVPCIAGGARG